MKFSIEDFFSKSDQISRKFFAQCDSLKAVNYFCKNDLLKMFERVQSRL